MNRSAVVVGAGCLACIGVPSLLAIGGAGGYFFAMQQRTEVAVVERAPSSRIAGVETETRDDSRDASSRRVRVDEPAREIAEPFAPAREIVIATPVARPTSTPEALASVAAPISTPAKPAATPELAKILAPAKAIATPVAPKPELAKIAAPISTPAPVVVRKLDVIKAAPIPKSTPRNFDEPDFAKPAKPSKVASAAGAAVPSETDEDVAVAALFGDAPGSSAPKPATAVPTAPAPARDPKVRTIKTRGGPVEVTLGKTIAIQGTDKKALLGTLEKVEAGWVAVRLADGKVRMIAENDIVEASDL